MSQKYAFNTKVLFLLGKLLKYYQKDSDKLIEIVKKLDSSSSDLTLDELIPFIMQLIASSTDAQDVIIELLAESTGKTKQDISSMDALDFIKEIKGFIGSIDWNRLMGESLGLVPNKELT